MKNLLIFPYTSVYAKCMIEIRRKHILSKIQTLVDSFKICLILFFKIVSYDTDRFSIMKPPNYIYFLSCHFPLQTPSSFIFFLIFPFFSHISPSWFAPLFPAVTISNVLNQLFDLSGKFWVFNWDNLDRGMDPQLEELSDYNDPYINLEVITTTTKITPPPCGVSEQISFLWLDETGNSIMAAIHLLWYLFMSSTYILAQEFGAKHDIWKCSYLDFIETLSSKFCMIKMVSGDNYLSRKLIQESAIHQSTMHYFKLLYITNSSTLLYF